VARRSGIGRGLAAILPEGEAGEELREVPVALIQPNPDQPRKHFDMEGLERLAQSLASAGVVQPLVVHPLANGRYQLLAGERRWRAARMAGLETVPAVLRSEPDGHRLQTALVENMAREDLNPVEEARACAALVEELDVSREEVARRLGRSRSSVSNLIRLLDLPDQVLDLLASATLSEGHGRALLAAKGQTERLQLARAAVRGDWSVRETERRVGDRWRHRDPTPRSAGRAGEGRGRPGAGPRPRGPGELGAPRTAGGDPLRRPRGATRPGPLAAPALSPGRRSPRRISHPVGRCVGQRPTRIPRPGAISSVG
jgi:ParB family chromosome partitioning protein